MNNSLTEQERLGLEEVFMSISSSRNLLQKWSYIRLNLTNYIQNKSSFVALKWAETPSYYAKNTLKNHKITNFFNKLRKRRKI